MHGLYQITPFPMIFRPMSHVQLCRGTRVVRERCTCDIGLSNLQGHSPFYEVTVRRARL